MSTAYELSEAQAYVLNILQQHAKPLTAYELLNLATEHGIRAPSQIYRILNQLMKKKRVCRLASMNMYFAYEINNKNQPLMFSTCTSCRTVHYQSVPELTHPIDALTHDHALMPEVFHFEILGQCEACISKQQRK